MDESRDTRAAEQVGAVRPVGRLDPEVARLERQRDRDQLGVDELAKPGGDESQQRPELDLARHRRDDLVQRLELARPAGGRLVEPRVLDRGRCLGGEEPGQLLVLVREVAAALLLGEVEVAEDDAAHAHGHAEERLHRRMPGREPDRARVAREVVQAQDAVVADERSEDAAPAWEVADLRAQLVVDARVDEALELAVGRVEHAERGVPGARQRGDGLDELLQERVERQLGRKRDPSLDQRAQAVLLLPFGVHTAIIAPSGYSPHAAEPAGTARSQK